MNVVIGDDICRLQGLNPLGCHLRVERFWLERISLPAAQVAPSLYQFVIPAYLRRAREQGYCC